MVLGAVGAMDSQQESVSNMELIRIELDGRIADGWLAGWRRGCFGHSKCFLQVEIVNDAANDLVTESLSVARLLTMKMLITHFYHPIPLRGGTHCIIQAHLHI